MTSASTTPSRTRRRAKATVCACLIPLLAACSTPPARPSGTTHHDEAAAAGVVVESVGAPIYAPPLGKAADPALAASCRAWTLNRDQVARFFAASREYRDGLGDAFYSLPCTITGELRAEGRIWTYEINAAATATWIGGTIVRRFGCADAACEPLVLMMPDDNRGE